MNAGGDDSAFDLVDHLLSTRFGTAGGELTIGGQCASELAGRFGTPLYVYDAELMSRQYGLLRRHLPEHIRIYYSVKANPNPVVVARFVAAGAGLEVASGGEFLVARRAGCPAERILFAGPAKSEEELALVVNDGIGEIHIESFEELETLDRIAASAGRTQDVAVRVNPAAEGSGGAMRMGGQAAPFGFDEEILEEVIRAISVRQGVRFSGIHMFAGTQVLDARVLLDQWTHAVEVARRASAIAGEPLRTVDLGGGLGIPYFSADRPLDVGALGKGARELLEPLASDSAFRGRTRWILEPGRFLTGPAGVYLAGIRSVKQSRGKTFVVLDGGMHHHLAASGNLGQVIKRDYPILSATRATEARAEPAIVVGPLCTPLDTLARKAMLPAVAVGEVLAVLQSGAYGLTASPVGFLSHPMPAEVMVEDGAASLIRERGSMATPVTPLP